MPSLRTSDVARLAARGLHGHPLRFALSALGIAIGIASILAIAGITQASKAELNSQLTALGTNLLTVAPARDLAGNPTRLPPTAGTMIRRIGPVQSTAAVGDLVDVAAYRTPLVPTGRTSSVAVVAVDAALLKTVRGHLGQGHWFTTANARFPTAVLGATAAKRLGITKPGIRLWIDGQWVPVIGILDRFPLTPELDAAVMLPSLSAAKDFGWDGTSTAVYVRADESQIKNVASVAPATASSEHPELVSIVRPSDALEAKLAADHNLNRLMLGLAAIGLLVGGIGVSNTMIIGALERRSEVGLRRALGATKSDIAVQFLAESVLMSTAGGAAGALIGYLVAAYYSRSQGWGFSLPIWQGFVAVLITAAVGTAAGLYPAVKAAGEPPSRALASP